MKSVTITTSQTHPVEGWNCIDYFPAIWILRRTFLIDVWRIELIQRTPNIITAKLNKSAIEIVISDMTPGALHRKAGELYTN